MQCFAPDIDLARIWARKILKLHPGGTVYIYESRETLVETATLPSPDSSLELQPKRAETPVPHENEPAQNR